MSSAENADSVHTGDDPWYDEIPPNWQAPGDLAVVLRAEADEDPTLHAVMWNTPRDQQLLRHAAATVERLTVENGRLRAVLDAENADSVRAVGEAMRAYHYDAEFHAAVEVVARVVDAEQRERTGLPLAEGQRDAIRMGALVALHLAQPAENDGDER